MKINELAELQDLQKYCAERGLETSIKQNDSNNTYYLVDSFGYNRVYAKGNNFYKISAKVLEIDDNNEVAENSALSETVHISSAYSFMDMVIFDNKDVENKY